MLFANQKRHTLDVVSQVQQTNLNLRRARPMVRMQMPPISLVIAPKTCSTRERIFDFVRLTVFVRPITGGARPFLVNLADVSGLNQSGFLFRAPVGAVCMNFRTPFFRAAEHGLQCLAVMHLRRRVSHAVISWCHDPR